MEKQFQCPLFSKTTYGVLMRHLDLFSGIGGFALAAEEVWGPAHNILSFCEIEPYAQKVLKQKWPAVEIIEDVRKVDGRKFDAELITGGFPCQDLSHAGLRKGFEGERSSLYSEMLRIISESMPRYAVFENVTGLLTGDAGRWFGKFLYDLASIGYDAEWHCISAANLGFPHKRERVWIISYPMCGGLQKGKENINWAQRYKGVYRPRPSCDIGGDLPIEWKDCEANCGDIREGDGVPGAAHRIKGLGNAIVPAIAVEIFNAIKLDMALI